MPAPARSRRDRPAKQPLSLEWIIRETLEIVRNEGLEKATMRRVAQALDTGPASLYVYVANTAELHAAVLDELIGTLPSRVDGDWRDRLHAALDDYARVLFAYPGLARSAVAWRPTGPHAIGLYDRVLGLLVEGGAPADRAAWGVDLLLQYVTAHAAEHSGEPGAPRSDDDLDTLRAALRSADPASAPHVAAHADALVSGSPEQRVGWAVDVLVAGITSTPLPS
ncbi:MAG: TetR/AcrR family transcriptional regulator [Angustibacter sp.]